MLERLFTSKTRIKILILLMFNQDSQFHLRDIARQIDISPIYVSKELSNLEKLNLVGKEAKGNLHLFQINKNCVIFEELRQIFIKTDYLGQLLKDQLIGKAKYVFIYGSFAKGIETELSDFDLFVVGEIDEERLISIIQKLEPKINREINYVLWTEKVLNQRVKGHHLLKSIKESKIIMLIGENTN